MRTLGLMILVSVCTVYLAAPVAAQQYKPDPYGPDASAPRAKKAKGIATGAIILVGGGMLPIAEDDREAGNSNMHPGAYLGSGSGFKAAIAYQGLSGPSGRAIYRLGAEYMGASHSYRHEDGSTWVTHVSGFGDVLYDWSGFRLGGRMGLGLGFGDLGKAYEFDNDKARSFLGLFIDLSVLIEIAFAERFVVGGEIGMTVDGWTGSDPNESQAQAEQTESTTTLGGIFMLYGGMVF